MKKLFWSFHALFVSASIATAQDAVAPPAQAGSPAPEGAASAERVIVTAGAIEHSETESIEPVSVLSQEELKRRAAATLGETLRDQPGVAASGFSAGASRPVIR
ncbi:MAG: TonB-dependent receptor plug domain-containing protein, partial [Chthoniobacterales bacterium]|nr:TonB-dependent receptor plug domain-containing protein [Chthoniobacterales bacterium]